MQEISFVAIVVLIAGHNEGAEHEKQEQKRRVNIEQTTTEVVSSSLPAKEVADMTNREKN